MKKTGEPFFVADGVCPSVADDGSLLYLTSPEIGKDRERRLVKIDNEGNATPIPDGGKEARIMRPEVSLSSDERFGLVSLLEPEQESGSIYRVDLENGIYLRLTSTTRGVVDSNPVWHPIDLNRVVFMRRSNLSGTRIMSIRVGDAPSAAVEFLDDTLDPRTMEFSISEDGEYLVYGDPSGGGDARSALCISLEKNGEPFKIVGPATTSVARPRISPDGLLLTYSVHEPVLTRFPSGEGYWQVPLPPSGASARPVPARAFWGKDGANLQLFCLDHDDVLHRVSVAFDEDSSEPEFGKFENLFDLRELGFEPLHPPLDPSQDGSWFLAALPVDVDQSANSEGSAQKAILVDNWFSEFKDVSPKTVATE